MRRLLIFALFMSLVAAGCAAQPTATPASSSAGLETYVDFNRGTFDQQLGQGWYQFEGQQAMAIDGWDRQQRCTWLRRRPDQMFTWFWRGVCRISRGIRAGHWM